MFCTIDSSADKILKYKKSFCKFPEKKKKK